jgi:hypothetical protein
VAREGWELGTPGAGVRCPGGCEDREEQVALLSLSPFGRGLILKVASKWRN